MARTAVFCSAHSWTSPIRLSAHHFARHFVGAGWRVAYVANPISPLHWARQGRDQITRLRVEEWRSGGGEDLGAGLFYYCPLALLPPGRLPGLRGLTVLRQWHRLTVPNVVRMLRRREFVRPDLLVLDTPMQGFWRETLAPLRTAYRVTDRNDAFASATPSILRREREIASVADLVLYTAASLEPYVASLKPRASLLLSHGVDFETFAKPAPPPLEYAAIPPPRVVYVGSMVEWFDFDLVADTARAMPGASVVLVGPDATAKQRLPSLPNLHLLGARPHATLPGYLQHAQVGIIPFDRRRWANLIDNVNPLKLYEYLACGLPVVSIAWPALEGLGSPAVLVGRREEFVPTLRATLAAPTTGEAERAFAAANTWAARTRSFMAALGLA